MSAFTLEGVKLRAECERKMDSGEIPFVMLDGHRVPTSKECIEELGLVAGQTINDALYIAMMRWDIANPKTRMAPSRAGEQSNITPEIRENDGTGIGMTLPASDVDNGGAL